MITDYSDRDWKDIAKAVKRLEASKAEVIQVQKQLYRLSHKAITPDREDKHKDLAVKRDQLKERITYLDNTIKGLLK